VNQILGNPWLAWYGLIQVFPYLFCSLVLGILFFKKKNVPWSAIPHAYPTKAIYRYSLIQYSIHMRLVVTLSFIKHCDPIEILFITCLFKITYTSQLLHLNLAATLHQINTPCALWDLSPKPHGRHGYTMKIRKACQEAWLKRKKERERLVMSKKKGKREKRSCKRSPGPPLITHAPSWSTCMMYYLYGSNLWFCNKCTASTCPQTP
jgi:hypothetical protein